MDHFTWGILTIAAALVLYYGSWRSFKANRSTMAVSLLIIAGLLLRIFCSADLYLHEWDERYHALVAKNMVEHPFSPQLYRLPLLPYDYRDWAFNHIWLHKPPFSLWLMACSIKLLGNVELAVRLPSILLSSAGVFLMFEAGRYLMNRAAAFLAAFLFSVHGLIIELAAGRAPTDHVDMTFLVLTLGTVCLGIRFVQQRQAWLNVLAGVVFGMAILTKWFTAGLILPVYLLVLAESPWLSRRQLLWHIGVFLTCSALVFLPWQLYIHRAFPLEAAWEGQYNLRHFSEALEEHKQPLLFHFDRLRIVYGELVYLPILFFSWRAFCKRRMKDWVIFAWFWLPYLFFTVAATKMPAYTLVAAPAVFLMTGWAAALLWRSRWQGYKRILARLCTVLLIALPVRYTIERVKPFAADERNPQWAKELRKLGEEWAGQQVIVIHSDKPIETMFYTPAIAYTHAPEDSISSWIQKGYKVWDAKEKKWIGD